MIVYDVIVESIFSCVSFIAEFADFVEDSLMKFLMSIEVANMHKLLATL